MALLIKEIQGSKDRDQDFISLSAFELTLKLTLRKTLSQFIANPSHYIYTAFAE